MKKSLIAIISVFILIFGLLPFLQTGQVKAASDPTGRGVGFTSVLYDNTNGLATSDTNAIVQTEEGFIWLGSYGGLIRYDGNTFHRYDASTGISSVVSLFADSKNRLWVGTNDSGIFVLEDGEFTSYTTTDGLNASSVRSILEDSDGNILIGTTLGMNYVDPEGSLHKIDDAWINGEYICELEPSADDTIYGLTNSGSFFSIRDRKVTGFFNYEDLGFGIINTIFPDPDNKDCIYLGLQDATVVYGNLANRMKDSTVYSVAPQQNVANIRKFDDQLWICADNGIGIIRDGVYTSLEDLPMTNSVEHIFMDHESNLWFTSSRQGLMKIVPNRFIDISKFADLPPLVVNSTLKHNDLLYLGTDTGLKILNEKFETVENDLTAMLAGVRIRSIHEDSKGILWFGTNSDYGLLYYNPATGETGFFNTDNELASNRARTILELSDGRIAVATNAGVNIIKDGKVTDLYDNKQGLRNLEILCLEEDKDGRILAGSDGDGIYLIDGNNVSRIGVENGLSSDVILRIHRDPIDDELFWVITSNAINYIKGNEVKVLHNFPYANNFDIVFDDIDCMWVLSSNGIYTVKREHMLKDENIPYNLYDIRSGLPSAPTANSYSYLTKDGTLYIAATTGVSSVDIYENADETGNVRLSIPFLMADDDYIYVKDGKATIPADCKRLTIFAYSFSYSLNNPHLSYSLIGFDDDITETTQHEMQPVTYTNLAGGEYTFRFSTVNTMTGDETQVLELALHKQKKLTEQVWFWILMILLLIFLIIGGVILYFRRKTKALLKKQQERERLIDEMTNVFAKCIDMKDRYTNGHSHRVARYAVMLAERMGKSKEELAHIHRIALLHDIGKISIPDQILNKPERLNDEEFAIMKTHSQNGAEILKEVSIEPDLAIGAGYHHERIDGRGYPKGLSGDDIPEIAQIIAVADTFDAMYSTRPYRKQVDINDVANEIRRIKGTQLNEEVADILLELIEEGAFDSMKMQS